MTKTRSIPMRRCIGCMESKPKGELVRIASYEGEIAIDPTGKAKGRGVYICPREECIRKALKKKAMQRSLSVNISEDEAKAILQGAIKREEE